MSQIREISSRSFATYVSPRPVTSRLSLSDGQGLPLGSDAASAMLYLLTRRNTSRVANRPWVAQVETGISLSTQGFWETFRRCATYTLMPSGRIRSPSGASNPVCSMRGGEHMVSSHA